MDEKRNERRQGKQRAADNGRVEQIFFASAASVICRAKVVAAECAAKRGSRLLQKDADYQDYRQNHLYIRQDTVQSH